MTRPANSAALDALRVKYLGKKGELTAVLKQMGKLSAEERPVMGQLANDVRAALEAALEAAAAGAGGGRPGRAAGGRGGGRHHPRQEPCKLGHQHPMYIALDEIKDIFIGMGFTVLDGPGGGAGRLQLRPR